MGLGRFKRNNRQYTERDERKVKDKISKDLIMSVTFEADHVTKRVHEDGTDG